MAVNFTNMTAAMTASWSAGLDNYSLTNTPLILQRDQLNVTVRTPNSQPLFAHPSTNCGGSSCGGPISVLSVRGVFMGTLGNHIGTSISTFQASSGKSTSSVQVFSCAGQPGC